MFLCCVRAHNFRHCCCELVSWSLKTLWMSFSVSANALIQIENHTYTFFVRDKFACSPVERAHVQRTFSLSIAMKMAHNMRDLCSLAIIEFRWRIHTAAYYYGAPKTTNSERKTNEQKKINNKKHQHLFFSHRFIKCNRTNENNEIEF